MSDTPRTDTAERMAFYTEYMVPTEFCRQLERELAEAREKLAKAINDYETAVLREHRMQEQRDTLAKTVRVYLDTERDGGILYSDALSELQEALAAVKGGSND